jgi:hypothetical protein
MYCPEDTETLSVTTTKILPKTKTFHKQKKFVLLVTSGHILRRVVLQDIVVKEDHPRTIPVKFAIIPIRI